jgi:alpha-beta hydrolase superfamily lysophospholipase
LFFSNVVGKNSSNSPLSLFYVFLVFWWCNFHSHAQSDLQTIKYRDMVIDLGNGLKTNGQLTIPAMGEGPFPGVIIFPGSGAGSVLPPTSPYSHMAEYLSERGFVVLRYDKRGVGPSSTISDSNAWGNLTFNNLKQDAETALSVLLEQPEVYNSKITVLGHSEGTMIAPRVAIDNPDKVKNIVLMGAVALNGSEMLDFQTVSLPLLYAKEVLDKDHNGSLSVQEASKDVTFQRIIGGNLSLILTQNHANGTKIQKTEYNPNNDTYINIENELKPALIEKAKSFFSPSSASTSSGKCTNIEGCPLYESSFFALEPNLSTITKVPSNTSILILNGENDTKTPVYGAFLLQQKLTEINHPDYTLITYPDLGHEFYYSSQWGQTAAGPIQSYVLADLYSWLESHSGFTISTPSFSSSNSLFTKK